MAFAGRTATYKNTPANIQTALTALAAANTVNGLSITVLSQFAWVVVAAYDTTAAGGQTVVVAPGDTLAATNTILDDAAKLATASVDVLEVQCLGEGFAAGVIVYK